MTEEDPLSLPPNGGLAAARAFAERGDMSSTWHRAPGSTPQDATALFTERVLASLSETCNFRQDPTGGEDHGDWLRGRAIGGCVAGVRKKKKKKKTDAGGGGRAGQLGTCRRAS